MRQYKIFLLIILTIVTLYIVNIGISLLREPSDIAVVAGLLVLILTGFGAYNLFITIIKKSK